MCLLLRIARPPCPQLRIQSLEAWPIEISFNEEISKIKKILLKNGYPSKLICNKIQDKMEFPKTSNEHHDPKAQPKRVVYLVLPYYNGAEDLKKKITDLVRTFFPEVYFRLMFKAHDTMGRHFNHKDKTQKAMKSKIVQKSSKLFSLIIGNKGNTG